MNFPIAVDPELGTKISKTCANCGQLLREIHIGPTTVLMCRGEEHATIIIEHPPGQAPSVFTREGLKTLGEEAVLDAILGGTEQDNQDKQLVCPYGCGFSTTSKIAHDKHAIYEEERRRK